MNEDKSTLLYPSVEGLDEYTGEYENAPASEHATAGEHKDAGKYVTADKHAGEHKDAKIAHTGNVQASAVSSSSLPLVVDLDGSLIKTELPWESFLAVLVKYPYQLLKIIKQKISIKEEGYFKIELEKWAGLSLKDMPFTKKFLNYLKEEKARGRKLVLCTGSTQTYAEKIQKLVGLFDQVWGSTLGKNLVGKKKALFLVGKYGENQFDYAGNSVADLKVARSARKFILVNPSIFTKFFSKKTTIHRRFMKEDLDPARFSYTVGFPLCFLNCIMFILPVFSPHSFGHVFFSFAFSAVYFNFSAIAFHVFFNMTHLERDRRNPAEYSKNLFATGDLNLSFGFLLSGLFFLLALVSFFYLALSRPLTIISSLFYIPCVYLLVHEKIGKQKIAKFIRYSLLIAVICLQGFLLL